MGFISSKVYSILPFINESFAGSSFVEPMLLTSRHHSSRQCGLWPKPGSEMHYCRLETENRLLSDEHWILFHVFSWYVVAELSVWFKSVRVMNFVQNLAWHNLLCVTDGCTQVVWDDVYSWSHSRTVNPPPRLTVYSRHSSSLYLIHESRSTPIILPAAHYPSITVCASSYILVVVVFLLSLLNVN